MNLTRTHDALNKDFMYKNKFYLYIPATNN